MFHFACNGHVTGIMTEQNKHSEGKAPMSQTKAAAALGITREHLNRVLRGHRQSPPLLARFAALQEEEAKRMSEEANPRFSQETTRAAGQASGSAGPTHSPRSADGASDNLHPEWGELVGRLGFCVCVVSVPHSDRLFKQQGFEENVGADLVEANLGQFDSVIWENPRLHFFLLHTKALRMALELIQSRLAALDLLTGCKIGCLDTAGKIWRTVYPAVEALPAPCPAPDTGPAPAIPGSDAPDPTEPAAGAIMPAQIAPPAPES